MERGSFLKTAGIAVAGLAFGKVGSALAKTTSKPNIVYTDRKFNSACTCLGGPFGTAQDKPGVRGLQRGATGSALKI